MNTQTGGDLFACAEQHLLSRDELRQRYGDLIGLGVRALGTAAQQQSAAPRRAFTLAGIRLWFAEGMKLVDEGVAAVGQTLAPPPALQPAFASRGMRSPENRRAAGAEEAAAVAPQQVPARYSATQSGQGCVGRIGVGEDPKHPERLRLTLEFLTPDGIPCRPFWVTVRDAAGQAKINRQRCDDLTFTFGNVMPADISFLLEDETGGCRVEFEMGAE